METQRIFPRDKKTTQIFKPESVRTRNSFLSLNQDVMTVYNFES